MPRDVAAEFHVADVVQQFRFSGSYFSTTAAGGVLERCDAALQLGQEYILVTQRRLTQPYPKLLQVLRERNDRSWTEYRLRLLAHASTTDDDADELAAYLGRDITPPLPKLSILWPPAIRYDPDGGVILNTTTPELIVRSMFGVPIYEAESSQEVTIHQLGNGLYQVDLRGARNEAVLWVHGGPSQRIRFECDGLAKVAGVCLRWGGQSSDLIALHSVPFAAVDGSMEVEVPSERLWRNIRVNGRGLRPIPNGRSTALDPPVHSLDVGAFGRIFSSFSVTEDDTSPPKWSPTVERLVTNLIGQDAVRGLRKIGTRGDLIQWAARHKAHSVLPIILASEAKRGIS